MVNYQTMNFKKFSYLLFFLYPLLTYPIFIYVFFPACIYDMSDTFAYLGKAAENFPCREDLLGIVTLIGPLFVFAPVFIGLLFVYIYFFRRYLVNSSNLSVFLISFTISNLSLVISYLSYYFFAY